MLGIVLFVLAVLVIAGIGYIGSELSYKRQLRSVLSTWRTFDECIKAGLDERYCEARFPQLCARRVIDSRLSKQAVRSRDCIYEMRRQYADAAGGGYAHCLSDEKFLHLFEQTMLSRNTLQYFEFCLPYPPVGPRLPILEWKTELPLWWVQRPNAV